MITLSGFHRSLLTDFNLKVRVKYGLEDAETGRMFQPEKTGNGKHLCFSMGADQPNSAKTIKKYG